jgi:metal-responsive CopG/Arc/MetJ family transcriptional regulator
MQNDAKREGAVMAKKPDENLKTIRSTVSIPVDQYEEIQRIANKKRVSVAWVIRDAIEHYLSADAPLFDQRL